MTAPEIAVRPDGSIAGIDGMLDQISGSFVRQLQPVVKETILPILQQDRELQRTIGQAAGREIAKPLWGLVVIAGVYAGWKIYRHGR